jgi:ATP-dependent exoDNAse (exonuclease V) alpha subunit|nr:MAG TPA: ATP dependent DNA helicase [Caudoviricetes sp.]
MTITLDALCALVANQSSFNQPSPVPSATSELNDLNSTQATSTPNGLDSSQQIAVRNICSSQLSILTGAAGTGKTFTLKAVLQELLTKFDASSIFLCAFTGKAVLNIIKSIKSDPALAPFIPQCLTLHKWLQFVPESIEIPDPSKPCGYRLSRRFVPTFNADNKRIDTKVLIIDEVSMVSNELMLQTLAALDLHSLHKLILVGDINQLQPVIGKTSLAYFGAHSGCSLNYLTTVHRQADGNDIVQAAHLFKSANLIALQQAIKAKEFKNVKFIKAENYLDLYRIIELINEKYHLRFNEQEDCIITPTNVGATGQEVLNQRLNKYLGVTKQTVLCGVAIKLFGVGDNVMFTKNNYEDGYINGTVGRIIEMQLNEDVVVPSDTNTATFQSAQPAPQGELSDAELGDLIDQSAQATVQADSQSEADEGFFSKKASHTLTIEFIDIYGTLRQISLSSIGEISNLLLANAITCYKAQGSTYKRCIINLLDWKNGNSINNEYAYTALTRASEFAWVIYNKSGLAKLKNRQLAGSSDKEKIENLISSNSDSETAAYIEDFLSKWLHEASASNAT